MTDPTEDQADSKHKSFHGEWMAAKSTFLSCFDICLSSAITPSSTKSTFEIRVQRSPPAQRVHTDTCQSSLSVWTMFKVKEKRKKWKVNVLACLWRKIRTEHLDTCPSRWSSLSLQRVKTSLKAEKVVFTVNSNTWLSSLNSSSSLPDAISVFVSLCSYLSLSIFQSLPGFRVGRSLKRVFPHVQKKRLLLTQCHDGLPQVSRTKVSKRRTKGKNKTFFKFRLL